MIRCSKCSEPKHKTHPCVFCFGSKNPASKPCSTCVSYCNRFCRRIEDLVEPSFRGCILHCEFNGTPDANADGLGSESESNTTNG